MNSAGQAFQAPPIMRLPKLPGIGRSLAEEPPDVLLPQHEPGALRAVPLVNRPVIGRGERTDDQHAARRLEREQPLDERAPFGCSPAVSKRFGRNRRGRSTGDPA